MRVATLALLQFLVAPTHGFNIAPSGQRHTIVARRPVVSTRPCLTKVRSTVIIIADGPIEPDDDDDDDSNEDESPDPYLEAAPSEFMEESKDDGSSSALSFQGGK